METPVILSIAGSDCSAGAGAQADLKTGLALGCYPLTALSCVVSEVPGCVAGIEPMPPDFVRSQIELCLSRFPVRAAKCGMLYSPDIIAAVADTLAEHAPQLPLVVDPVMVATAGEPLMQRAALAAYNAKLFPRATLITPNCDELTVLLGDARRIDSEEQLAAAATELVQRLGCAVLAKGGHLRGDDCTDILALPGEPLRRYRHPRSCGISTHGTGCTLSAAVTAGLAQGRDLPEAVERALHYTARAIARSHRWGTVDALCHRAED